jgi:hypothetical protein
MNKKQAVATTLLCYFGFLLAIQVYTTLLAPTEIGVLRVAAVLMLMALWFRYADKIRFEPQVKPVTIGELAHAKGI